ncbi:PD40 domain-containing protein [Anaeromyxobacter sp. Fw109-5]|uniref:PD40 domain-containing protein n=1 Tax=Anaeromyxobacter sp. (strain Fw109-5) TaxID=404589 RepID=UPI00059DD0F3|nr:PD40 domain-containing protein [Anaeromyxobacter sp. Fw109-5]
MRVLALLALTLPLAAGAQLGPGPSVGEAMHAMERVPAEKPPSRAELEQTYILPERPGQNQVAWFDFDWQFIDVPSPGGGPGGIRLYYYRNERAQAERALPAIQSAYARLVDQFHYNPTKRIPYILYATQREFQTQNVFAVTESVLGVTSPEDLKMSVPYFGDHARFTEVSTHEMVHQFTIQKLLEAAGAEEMTSPIAFLPLWFIEGIAEYYTKGGIDVETDLYLRDLVWNPDPRRGYDVLPFGEDRIRGYIPTYKLGQARIAFIADQYGREKIQAFLENAYLLGDGGTGFGGGGSSGGTTRNFGGLVRRVLNEPIEQVDARWRAWLKRRYYPQYLEAKHDLSQLREVRRLPAEPEDFVSSADGNVLLFRGIDRRKGRARLYLMDVRNPRSAIEIVSDSAPGFESLHPIEYGVIGLGHGILAFSAQDGIGDRLHVQRFRHRVKEGRPPRIELGRRRKLDVRAPSGAPFIQIADPAFSPDGSQIAFAGVSTDGQSDVYVVSVKGGEAKRLTNDFYVEKDVAWGADGIYCSSDATDHGRMNLFRLDPSSGARTRLTTGPSTDRGPFPQEDGSVLFSSDVAGKPDLYRLKDGSIQRITDFTTGLTSPGPSPKGRGVFASTFYGGFFKLVEVPKVAWLEQPGVAVAPPAGDVLAIPEAAWPDDVKDYESLSIRNWKPEAGFVYGGGAGSSVAGRAAVLFSDMLRDNILYVDLSVYGSFDYTQGLALFENRAQRLAWILGGFHFVQQNLDRLDPNLAYYQRDFGVVGALRYPLDRFRRVEAELTLGGVQRYCLTDFTGAVTLVCEGIQIQGGPYGDTAGWKDANGGVNFQVSPTLRFGYDTIRYDMATGPVAGGSLMLELGGGYLPSRSAVHGFFRADAQKYWQLLGRSNFGLRTAIGTTFSPNEESQVWEKSYWLTSADNLRGFYPLDIDYLIGQHYYVMNAELQFPLDPLIRLLIFDYLEGVAALDFGGVFNRFESAATAVNRTDLGAWDSRTLTGVLGVNVLFGPLLLRVHFGHPFDIGGLETPALRSDTRWVTNVTLRYFFF